MWIMNNYDKILNSVKIKQKNCDDSIQNKLSKWAASEDESLYHQNNYGKELQECISAFYKKFEEDTILDELEENFSGWECGLCQMIDITNKNVCELLPFLLTAYIYNFPKNQFVSSYLKSLKENNKKYSYTDDWFCGLEIPEAENDNEFVGIGKLLNQQMRKSERNKEQLSRLKDRFHFPQTVHSFYGRDESKLESSDSVNSKRYYIMPEIEAEKQQKYLERYYKKVKKIAKGQLYAPMNRTFRNTKYSLDFIIDIFATWDEVLSEHFSNQNKNVERTSFACAPDHLQSWILLCDELKLNFEIEEMKSLCNVCSDSELQEKIESRVNKYCMHWLRLSMDSKISKRAAKSIKVDRLK